MENLVKSNEVVCKANDLLLLAYAAETWVKGQCRISEWAKDIQLESKDKSRIQTSEIKFLRSRFSVIKMEKTTNEREMVLNR